MVKNKTVDGYIFDTSEVSVSNNELAINSLQNEIKQLAYPKLSDYIDNINDQLGIGSLEQSLKQIYGFTDSSVMDAFHKIYDSTSSPNINSLINQPAISSLMNTHHCISDLLGTTTAEFLKQQSYINKIAEEYRLSGLEQASAMNDAFLAVNNLTDFSLSDYHASLIRSAFGSHIFDGVSLLNDQLAELALATEVKELTSVSKLVDNHMLMEANKITSSIENIYKDNVTELLAQEQIKLNDIYNNSTLASAISNTQKVLGLSENTSTTLLNSLSDSIANLCIDNAVFRLADIRSEQLSKLLDTSLYQGMGEIEELIRLSTLSAFEVFESYYNHAEYLSTYDEELYELKESLSEIKQTLNKSSTITNVQFYVSFLISILSILYAIQSSTITEGKTTQQHKELKSGIESIETTMVTQFFILNQQLNSMDERLEQLEKSIHSDIVEYVVIRPAELRTQSNTSNDSLVIAVLQPNQKVELLKRKGKWIYVGYFDYIEDIPKTGWVMKKYLKMIK